jgi:hypothetical protein
VVGRHPTPQPALPFSSDPAPRRLSCSSLRRTLSETRPLVAVGNTGATRSPETAQNRQRQPVAKCGPDLRFHQSPTLSEDSSVALVVRRWRLDEAPSAEPAGSESAVNRRGPQTVRNRSSRDQLSPTTTGQPVCASSQVRPLLSEVTSDGRQLHVLRGSVPLVLLNQPVSAGQRPVGPRCVADAWQESRSTRGVKCIGASLGTVVGSP